MEIIVELLVNLVVQVVGEILVDAGVEGLGAALRTTAGRIILGTTVAAGLGFAFGWWWGDRYANTLGTSDVPTSLVVSVALTAAFGVLTGISAIRSLRAEEPDHAPPGSLRSLTRWLPWRWAPARLAGFALANAAVAVGITVGFTPEEIPLR
jgi:hypothetical protein